MRLGDGRIWMDFGSLEVFISDVGHEFRKGDHLEISVKGGIFDEPGGVGNDAEDFVLNAFKLDFPGWSEGGPCGAAVG